MWGNRFGNINTHSKYVKKTINKNYLKPAMYGKSGDMVRRIITEKFKTLPISANGERYCVFLIFSEVKPSLKEQQLKTHGNVLVVRLLANCRVSVLRIYGIYGFLNLTYPLTDFLFQTTVMNQCQKNLHICR